MTAFKLNSYSQSKTQALSLFDHQITFNEAQAETDLLSIGFASHCLMKRTMFMSPV